MINSDPLYSIFEQHLFSAIVEDETSEAFVQRVVNQFMLVVQDSGHISAAHREALREDLREEVLEMLRKKIYGHPNLKLYRESIKNQTHSVGSHGALKKKASS